MQAQVLACAEVADMLITRNYIDTGQHEAPHITRCSEPFCRMHMQETIAAMSRKLV